MICIVWTIVFYAFVVNKADGDLSVGGPFLTRASASSFMTSLDNLEFTVGGACFRDQCLNTGRGSCKMSKYLDLNANCEQVFTHKHPVYDPRVAIVDVDFDSRSQFSPYRYQKKAATGRNKRYRNQLTGVIWNKITRYSPPSPCINEPCVHGGSCFVVGSSFRCQCQNGWTGSTCAEDVNECASSPCQNGATCNNLQNQYTCSCRPGWEGVNCETDIDECLSGPCQNGGTCNNLENLYTCTCPEDFIGYNCQTDSCIPSNANGADVVFAIDSTTSQGNSYFEAQKQYIKDFINNFEVSPTNFQISLVSFSFNATVHCYLNTHASNITLHTEIDRMTFNGGPSYTGNALKTIRETVLTAHNGMRANVSKYVIVLTDGLSSDRGDTVTQADLLKANQVGIFSVAFGSQIGHTELIDIATNSMNVFPFSIPDPIFSVLKRHMPSCPDCFRNTSDVILLFDSSTDISPQEFYPAVDAVRTLVSGMTIGPDNIHVSYIKYAQNVNEEFDFTQYQTTNEVVSQITRRLTQSVGPANLSKAFDHVISNGFSASKGARTHARKFVIAFTQGKFNDFGLVKNSAETLKNSGVILAAVGIGNDANLTALLEIASEPVFAFVIGSDVDIENKVLLSLTSSFEFDVCEFD